MKNIARAALIVLLTGVFCLSGFKLFQMSEGYIREAKLKDGISAYHPAASNDNQPMQPDSSESALTISISSTSQNSSEATPPDTRPPAANQYIIDLQNEINRDVVGWLTIPGTKIDYPFVKGADNDYYVNRDLFGEDAPAGTIFIDERNAADLSDFNTILYGHNMKNGMMFGGLPLYSDEWYFNDHNAGTLYLVYGTYHMEIFAYMVVRSDDEVIYGTDADSGAFFGYVRENARYFREPAATDKVVTLSACAYEFDSARVVVIASVSQEPSP